MKMTLLKSSLVLLLIGAVSGCKSTGNSDSSSKMLSEDKQTLEPRLRSIVMSHRDVMQRYMSRIRDRIPPESVDNQLKQNLKSWNYRTASSRTHCSITIYIVQTIETLINMLQRQMNHSRMLVQTPLGSHLLNLRISRGILRLLGMFLPAAI